MDVKSLKTISPESYELDKVQRNVNDWTNQLTTNPLLSGTLIENITITTGNNVINHKLNRNIRGWIVTDTDSNITLYKASTQTIPTRTLTLVSSGNGTVSLYIF